MGPAALKRLRTIKVAVIGLGTLGGATVQFLTQSGIQHFILVDPDELGAHNLSRHICWSHPEFVGMKKVTAVGKMVRAFNPKATVKEYARDAIKLLANPKILAAADVVVVAGLGSEIATSQLARILRKQGKTVLYAGLYEKAIAGEVFLVNNAYPSWPCYHCFASILRGFTPENEEKFAYGMDNPDEVRAQPGLSDDAANIASIVHDWVLRLFANDPEALPPYTPNNLVIFGNGRYVIGTDAKGNPITIEPHCAKWFQLRKDPKCGVCGESVPLSPDQVSDLLN